MVRYFKMKWYEDRNKEVKKEMRLEIKDGWKKIFLSDMKRRIILKKLDRVMVSEKFLDAFVGRQAVFQPFLISEHSPAIMIIPTCGAKKAKSFRFANYTGFINEASEGWNVNVNGHKIYYLVKKLKHIKPILNKLIWKHGDLTASFDKLIFALQIAQSFAEKNPHDKNLKAKTIEALDEYNEAVKDE
uniref:RNA-directed DNA polymerase, eukaryota, reverse transcriptase zinc-binding domain protein n=1 Tax=Tanacetum cinerariifolium TaxID=118510 RepID=A0A699K1A5_TANCI|nr:hypothetical protein [Tanacetum cinerariifolium]